MKNNVKTNPVTTGIISFATITMGNSMADHLDGLVGNALLKLYDNNQTKVVELLSLPPSKLSIELSKLKEAINKGQGDETKFQLVNELINMIDVMTSIYYELESLTHSVEDDLTEDGMDDFEAMELLRDSGMLHALNH